MAGCSQHRPWAQGWAAREVPSGGFHSAPPDASMAPLLNAIVEHVPPPGECGKEQCRMRAHHLSIQAAGLGNSVNKMPHASCTRACHPCLACVLPCGPFCRWIQQGHPAGGTSFLTLHHDQPELWSTSRMVLLCPQACVLCSWRPAGALCHAGGHDRPRPFSGTRGHWPHCLWDCQDWGCSVPEGGFRYTAVTNEWHACMPVKHADMGQCQ